jgi:hypothetical protein
MLLFWIVGTDSERYPAIDANMSLAYISDIGAYEMKPLFIAGSAVTTVTFDLAFLAERFLRHRGRLVPNQSTGEKVLMGLSIFCALVGTAGLILLSVFDTVRYSTVHNICLCLFIGGYLFSAVFICWEYQRLGISKCLRDFPLLDIDRRADTDSSQRTALIAFFGLPSGSSSPSSSSNSSSSLPLAS